MIDAPSSVWDIERNDLDACAAYYAAHGVNRDEMRVMLMLQDDSTRLREIAVDWTISERTVGKTRRA